LHTGHDRLTCLATEQKTTLRLKAASSLNLLG
jgi:hypothetical protein